MNVLLITLCYFYIHSHRETSSFFYNKYCITDNKKKENDKHSYAELQPWILILQPQIFKRLLNALLIFVSLCVYKPEYIEHGLTYFLECCVVVSWRRYDPSCKVFQYTLINLNLFFNLFSVVGLERLFTEEKNQDNERRRIDICGNGELQK